MSTFIAKATAAVSMILAGIGFTGSPQNIGDTISTLPPVKQVGNAILPRDGDADFAIGHATSTASAPFSVNVSGDDANLMSSGSVTFRGLLSCNTIDTNASGLLVCGTDETGGGGGGASTLQTREGFSGAWNTTASLSFNAAHFAYSYSSPEVQVSQDWGAGGPASLSQAETITGNWDNTANPWADNEVADDITASNYYLASNPSGYITDGNTNWDNSYGFITSSASVAEFTSYVSASQFLGSAFASIPGLECSDAGDTLNWANGVFTCGTDSTGGGGGSSALNVRDVPGSYSDVPATVSFDGGKFTLTASGSTDVKVGLDWGAGGPASLSEAETIAANWVNTANPWADNEVADAITINGGTIGSNTLSSGATFTGSGSVSANWEVVGYASASLFTGSAFGGIDCNDAGDQLLWSGGGFTCETLADGDIPDTITASNYYLASNPSNYIALTAISETITGITYTSGTGVFSLDAGYVIPLTASVSAWESFKDTPSSVITAGTGIDWSGNTLNVTVVDTDTDTTNSNIPFLTVGNTSSLSFERSFAVDTDDFQLTDGGVNSTYTLAAATGKDVPLTASISAWETFRDTPSTRITATAPLEWSSNTLRVNSSYGIPLVASATAWEGFYDTPSGRITAGDNLSWSGNTLNVDDSFLLNSGDNATGLITFGAGASVTAGNFEVRGISSASFFNGSAFAGIPGAECSDAGDTLAWANGVFTCGTDATGAGGVASDGLDFDELEDAMDLDANLTIASHAFGINLTDTVLDFANEGSSASLRYEFHVPSDTNSLVFRTGDNMGYVFEPGSSAGKFIIEGNGSNGVYIGYNSGVQSFDVSTTDGITFYTTGNGSIDFNVIGDGSVRIGNDSGADLFVGNNASISSNLEVDGDILSFAGGDIIVEGDTNNIAAFGYTTPLLVFQAAADGWVFDIGQGNELVYNSGAGTYGLGDSNDHFIFGNTASVSSNLEVVGRASASLFLGSAFSAVPGSECSDAGDTLNWANGVFTCGTDATGGGGVSSDSLNFDEFQNPLVLDTGISVSSVGYAWDWLTTDIKWGNDASISLMHHEDGDTFTFKASETMAFDASELQFYANGFGADITISAIDMFSIGAGRFRLQDGDSGFAIASATLDRFEVVVPASMSSLYVGGATTLASTLNVTGLGTFGAMTATGVLDFGGATSLEIPNGTAPTVDVIGEVAYDSTDFQLLVASSSDQGPLVFPGKQRLWGATIASTSADFFSGGRIWLPLQRDGFTIREIHCAVDGGTSVVINISNSGGTTDTETVTCDADGQTDTAIGTNPKYAAGSLNSLEIGTVTGSVDYLTFSVYGTYTRE